MESNPCADKVLAAINRVFSADLTENCVNWGECGLHGGAYNLVLSFVLPAETKASVQTFNKLLPGRYALSGWKNYLYGGGTHLHVPSGGETVPCSKAVPFLKDNVGGRLSASFTAHIDNGWPYHPAGFVYHMIRNVAMSGSRNPCP